MSNLLNYQKVDPTTWVYLSSLLTIGLYFKFSRLWSVRNLDLIGLILFAPGLLLVGSGRHQDIGYIWLFVMGGIFMFRLLLDPMMVRRPLLEPNLSVGGMTFIGTSLLVFLMANVLNSKPTADDMAGAAGGVQISKLQGIRREPNGSTEHGPGYPWLYVLPSIPTQFIFADAPEPQSQHELDQRRHVLRLATARTLAILSHIAVVIGMVVIGYRHFDNIKTGIAAALLYLLLPYTAQMTGQVIHVVPAALLIWSLEAYRRPLISGMLMGVAIGVIYYPIFLLPLWLGFYWQRGLVRFSAGVIFTLAIVALSLLFREGDYWPQLQQMFGLLPWRKPVTGFWALPFIDPVYRLPVLAGFLALSFSLALWPAQKNLGTLMSCSAAVMLGTQFWHGDTGGLYMAWYLPLMLLTIFRPNLEDRVALTVLHEGWFPRRLAALAGAERAA